MKPPEHPPAWGYSDRTQLRIDSLRIAAQVIGAGARVKEYIEFANAFEANITREETP